MYNYNNFIILFFDVGALSKFSFASLPLKNSLKNAHFEGNYLKNINWVKKL